MKGLNLSKVWDLPVLWVCENNQYGMGTTVERASAVSEIRQKAEGYGIPNKRVEGMDVLEVKKETEKALKHIREGNGPYFLEIMTYRFRGHSMGDPEKYRESEEVDPLGGRGPDRRAASLDGGKQQSYRRRTEADHRRC